MLEKLSIPENKIKQLTRARINSLEDLLYLFPRKYNDRTVLTGFQPAGTESVILFHMESVRYVNASVPMVKASGYDCETKFPVEILWFNQSYLYNQYSDKDGMDVLVAGNAVFKQRQYNAPDRYEFVNPAVFDFRGKEALGLYPIYRKIPGMAPDYLQNCILQAANILGRPQETVPGNILAVNGLIPHASMVAELHWPTSKEGIDKALERKLWDDLLYFALRVELNYRGASVGSPYNLTMLQKTKALIDSLPFTLTEDQQKVYESILAFVRTGRRVNALIQGDVGTGKTIIAILLMVAFAENGYQTCIMAPTQILAKQHYDEICQRVKPLGIDVAFVSGQKLQKAEQQSLESRIASGDAKIIVGTQALLSNTYSFKNLALVIEDEEHKYGVLQRKALSDKAAAGTHTITMSATPIPRSLAQTIYGDNVQLYSVITKPPGRQPVKTGILKDTNTILNLIYREVKQKGHQAYVVCPMIAPSEKVEGVKTVEEIYAFYKDKLEPYGICVGAVTGKTKKTEAQEILDAFVKNEIHVLVATTMIEVGVNVPNASCIVIQNAERFGLAQLHQLRGRVGRGRDQAFCVLASEDTENLRLQTMCRFTDGFKVAEMDLQIRGAGDFLGSQQSGNEKYLALALQYGEKYRKAQEAAKWILDSGADCSLLQKALSDQKNNVEGEMLKC